MFPEYCFRTQRVVQRGQRKQYVTPFVQTSAFQSFSLRDHIFPRKILRDSNYIYQPE